MPDDLGEQSPLSPDGLSSEEDLQEWLVDVMDGFGWDAIREMSPDHSDYRADIVAKHGKFGWLGIETKFLRDKNWGRDLAHAHHQIVSQYRPRSYLGHDVDLWAICAYPSHVDRLREWNSPRMREFMNVYGIGWINLNDRWLEADFSYSDVSMKIPLGGVGRPVPEDRIVETDVESVSGTVRRKIESQS